jgi:hypothetical protein
MTYFSILSLDLKSELLQYFWLNDIDELSKQLTDFQQLRHNELFWREIYKTHIDKDFSYRDICLKKCYAILKTRLTKESGIFNRTMLDSCIYHSANNSLVYCIDKTNNSICENIIRPDRYVSSKGLRKLVANEDTSTLHYLYNKGYISEDDIAEVTLSNLTLFKHFVPSIIKINKGHYLGLFANIYLVHPNIISNSKLYDKYKEVEQYLLSEVF